MLQNHYVERVLAEKEMRLRINLRLQTIMSMVAAGAFVFTLSACSSSGGNKTDQADTVAANYAQQIVNLGPGVQEACVSAGGLPALNLELNGTQTAVCQFANGKRCAADIIQSGACI